MHHEKDNFVAFKLIMFQDEIEVEEYLQKLMMMLNTIQANDYADGETNRLL